MKKPMKMLKLVVPLISMFASAYASAATFNFTGNIAYHNDIVVTGFTLNADATNVRVWTDSFQSGANFDPITALWDSAGNLLMQNDDDDTVNPATQTYYDSGFTLATLGAGDYFFSVATFANFAAGSTLSDGFAYDAQTPIALADWCQPANTCNMGTNWSVWLDGVDDATPPGEVPVPAAAWLFGSALIGLAGMKRKK